jgi:hypothetical protein
MWKRLQEKYAPGTSLNSEEASSIHEDTTAASAYAEDAESLDKSSRRRQMAAHRKLKKKTMKVTSFSEDPEEYEEAKTTMEEVRMGARGVMILRILARVIVFAFRRLDFA